MLSFILSRSDGTLIGGSLYLLNSIATARWPLTTPKEAAVSNAMGSTVRFILILLLLVPLACNAFAEERAAQKRPNAWIKLCEMRRPPKDIGVCMTLHERADGQTGEVLISAALRQTAGEDKEYFRVMLPRGLVEQHIH